MSQLPSEAPLGIPSPLPRPGAPVSKHQDPDETVRQMLTAAEQILHEWLRAAAPQALLGQIRATDVSRRIGMSTGAFFHRWPNQESFRAQFLEHLLSRDRVSEIDVEGGREAIRTSAATNEEGSLAEMVRTCSMMNFDGWHSDAQFDIQLYLLAGRGSDPRIARELRLSRRVADRYFVPMLLEYLTLSGRRLRPPFTLDSFTVVLTALTEGLHIRQILDPDAVPTSMRPPTSSWTAPVPAPQDDDRPRAQGSEPDDDNPRWNLFASIVYVLVEAMTLPGSDQSA